MFAPLTDQTRAKTREDLADGFTPPLRSEHVDLQGVPASAVTVLGDLPAAPAPNLVLPGCVARQRGEVEQPLSSDYSFEEALPICFLESGIMSAFMKQDSSTPFAPKDDTSGSLHHLGVDRKYSPTSSQIPPTPVLTGSQPTDHGPQTNSGPKQEPFLLETLPFSLESTSHAVSNAATVTSPSVGQAAVRHAQETVIVPDKWVWADSSHFERAASPVGPLPGPVGELLCQQELNLAMQAALEEKLSLRERLKREAATKPQHGTSSQISSRREAEVSRQFVHMKVEHLSRRLREVVKKNAVLTALCKQQMGASDLNGSTELLRSSKRPRMTREFEDTRPEDGDR